MQPWAKSFYKSKTWQRCRAGYIKSVGGLCEKCRARGLIVPGEIVHHKIHLTPGNIWDQGVSLAWDNLEFLCRDCHAKEHGQNDKRFDVNENGEVIFLEIPPEKFSEKF